MNVGESDCRQTESEERVTLIILKNCQTSRENRTWRLDFETTKHGNLFGTSAPVSDVRGSTTRLLIRSEPHVSARQSDPERAGVGGGMGMIGREM